MNICVNGQCASNDMFLGIGWIINTTIELNEGDDMYFEVNTSLLLDNICNLTGLSHDDVLVGT